jgi:reverse gyrase
VKLFKAKTYSANEKVLLDMMEFSQEMEKILGTLYKHNGYQSTVTASVVALDKKCTYVKLPTSSGKTFVGGMLGSYYSQKKKLIVEYITLSDTLRDQTYDLLGRICENFNFRTPVEFFALMPKCDLVIFDEMEKVLLDHPYDFLPNDNTKFNGIWNLA